jgi:hypothetical protein
MCRPFVGPLASFTPRWALRRPVSQKIEARILELRATGIGILKIARQLGIGTSVVQRVVAA